MKRMRTTRLPVALLLLAGLAGCDGLTSPKADQPVDLLVTAASSQLSLSALNTGPVQVSKVEIVLGEASLGGGEQFGCNNCQGNYEGAGVTPRIISVPVDGGAVRVGTEQVGAGTYAEMEISVERLPSSAAAQAQGWPADATIRVTGTVDGAAFEIVMIQEGTLLQQLPIPITVRDQGSPAEIEAVLDLSVPSWFQEGDATLDPRDPADLNQIKANITSMLGQKEG